RRLPRPTHRPNYAARRVGVALGGIVAAISLVSVFDAVLAGFGASQVFADDAVSAAPGAVHVARAGDSLWSIADEHRGQVGRDGYVRALIELNGSTTIIVGQAVALP
ncbi:LysM peptidoglycan-binding domain-containing protein, partial [Ilumatobacter sp.]|uniref:LysM peptidoglycan-binding domain-containing protein n=1 Tax=Ilumatobacter sp. TaxID=1967498 RepID=UPI003C5F8498